MTLNTAFLIFSGIAFTVCTVTFLYQAFSALNFRHKIAYTHGFSEGILTGCSYTAMIITLSLMFFQLLSFLIFPVSDEVINIIRALIYFISIICFFIFKLKTPPLLAYWFGKSAFWEDFGVGGKINYEDIYGARLSRKVKFPVMNNQQLCKVSFYVSGKNRFFAPKKYVCRLTAYELTALATQVTFHPYDYKLKKAPLAKRLPYMVMPYLVFITLFSFILPFFSSGIMNKATFESSDIPSYEKIFTVTSPSASVKSDDKICVYYSKIGIINVYNENNDFIYCISVKRSFTELTSFGVQNGKIYYKVGSEVSVFNLDNGVIIEKFKQSPEISESFTPISLDKSILPPDDLPRGFFKIFDVSVYYFITLTFLTLSFICHYIISEHPKKSAAL